MNREAPRAPADLIAALGAIVGEAGLITAPEAMRPMEESWRDDWGARAAVVVQPASTAEVQEVVKLCAARGIAVVPQGGNTGLTGAGVPDESGHQVVLATRRMTRIRSIDVENDTITVEAGAILASIQQAAREAGRLFPLSLGAEGSCAIGGNISTNAGGINVLRYGSARNLVLGLEVVLADGRVWDGLRGLRKDNAGYDLKQVFIGAEGTLGVITAAVLRLSPLPRTETTAMVAVASPKDAVRWLMRVKSRLGDVLSSFELIQRFCVEVAQRRVPGIVDPLPETYPWYVLLALSSPDPSAPLEDGLQSVFAEGLGAGEVLDGVIASSRQQADALWKLREAIPEGHRHEGSSFKHDISVPISRVPEFLDRAGAALAARFPTIRPFAFGHLGDGNLHYNPLQGEGEDPGVWKGRLGEVNRIVHDVTVALGGSISAEHGIGRLRRRELEHYKSPVELDLMAALKQALDPHGLFNPGKLLPPR